MKNSGISMIMQNETEMSSHFEYIKETESTTKVVQKSLTSTASKSKLNF